MKKYIAFLIMISFVGAANAQDLYLSTIDMARELSQKFTGLWIEKKIPESFDAIRPYWANTKSEQKGVENQTKELLDGLFKTRGNPIGYYKLREQKISDFAMKEVYLVRLQNSPLRLIFYYYRNDKGWLMSGFKWDDAWLEEFD